MTQDEIYRAIARVLQDTFELDPSLIKPEARLREDLDIDSIDAVDLIVQLKPLIGRRPDPDDFKQVRTLQDVVNVLARLTQSGTA